MAPEGKSTHETSHSAYNGRKKQNTAAFIGLELLSCILAYESWIMCHFLVSNFLTEKNNLFVAVKEAFEIG